MTVRLHDYEIVCSNECMTICIHLVLVHGRMGSHNDSLTMREFLSIFRFLKKREEKNTFEVLERL